MLLPCSPPTSENGPAAAVCVCVGGLSEQTGVSVCAHQNLGGTRRRRGPEARGWLPITPRSGSFQVMNEIVFVKVGGSNMM